MVPAKTSAEIVGKLHREFTDVIGQADMKERLAKVGFDPVASTPDAFAKQIAAELDTWRKVIQSAKIKAQ